MKKKSIKILSILLCLAMIFSLGACSPAGSTEGGTAYKAGTYTAVAKGHNGDVKVEVEFSDAAILSIKIVEHSESAGISDVPMKRIPEEVIEGQTLAVDTVAGATVSSKAILAAIEDAVKQAGGNVDALKANKKEDTAKTETELTTDVVVVGAGGAGLAAAASAHENGAKVIVLEKQATVGGSTALSGGAISAPESRFQKELGINDSKQAWTDLWKERQSTSNPNGKYPDYNFLAKFMDEAVVTTEWLVDYVGHQYETVKGFGVDPAERLHFPLTDGKTKGGTAVTQNIEKFILGEGIEILTETKATELIADKDGNITGVVAESKSGKVTIHAKKVILAAGGYAKNEELLERFIPKAAGTAEISAAAAGSTGDGIIMAEKVGAALYEEPWVIGLGVGSKVEGTGSLMMDWTKVYVNGDGERFTSEEVHYAIATNKVLEQKSPWIVLDSADANAKLIEALEAGMSTGEVVKADTLEALAEAMGVPVDTLVQTIRTYNEGAKAGKDAMGKNKDYLASVEKAPYYGVKLYGKTMGTFAGVKTNDSFQVLREDGSVINNLYAAGENANKVLYNQVYMSGSAVQFALTSGRLAGAHAAQNLK
ncbi:FAD-dependent oxidoreductase [Alkaliphilus oremlandii]|uniref:Urocanate reductase n=1 Tax=Alkaliphilus oremlandii (strain OhILAs) TaxID=350688 RepID=A8MJ58_ALKOO|nr:FAD-dependent oxidoreductase [Alkaliphilus oremlandii]ABW19840.1 fumarate reductase/succinate dehydrogenase flavoprotein domain protein [Alkaliphilus oremlandii OhILAs]